MDGQHLLLCTTAIKADGFNPKFPSVSLSAHKRKKASLEKKSLGTWGAKKMFPKGHQTELRCHTNSIAILNNLLT